MVFTSSRFSRGTLINREETIGALPMNTPAEDTPMASTRGILEAAVRNASTNPIKMVLGVLLGLGMPDHLFRVDCLAVHHGGDLPV